MSIRNNGETYAAKEHLDDLKKDAANLLRLLNGYIRYLQKQRAE